MFMLSPWTHVCLYVCLSVSLQSIVLITPDLSALVTPNDRYEVLMFMVYFSKF